MERYETRKRPKFSKEQNSRFITKMTETRFDVYDVDGCTNVDEAESFRRNKLNMKKIKRIFGTRIHLLIEYMSIRSSNDLCNTRVRTLDSSCERHNGN